MVERANCPMAFDFGEVLGHDLAWFDVSGARGSLEFPLRTNLLVVTKEVFFDEDQLILKVDHFSPEGFGYHQFQLDHLAIPSVEKLSEDILILWDVQKSIPPIGDAVWIMGVTELEFLQENHFNTTDDAFWMPLLERQHSPSNIRLLELCAGGYGGWKGASTFLQSHCQQNFQTVGVEIDLHACLSYAVAHSAILCQPGELDRILQQFPDRDIIVSADVMNTIWWQAASKWNPHVITLSSSCKPWSSAALGQGLCRADGLLLFRCLLMCRFFQPPIICIEQVNGFALHPHKHWIIRTLHYCGYRISWQGSLDLQDQSPTARIRWLCIAVRVSDQLPPLKIQPWNRIVSKSPISEDAIFTFSDSELQQLVISPETADLAANSKFHKSLKGKQLVTPKEVMNSRVNDGHSVTPTFMAMYGSQHDLDLSFLEKFGYFGHFKLQAELPFQCRYWHPLEIILLHGHFGDAWLDSNIHQSYLSVGNMIAIPHALFVLLHVANCVGTVLLTPFWVFTRFHQVKLRAANLALHRTSLGSILMPQSQHCSCERIASVERLFETFLRKPDDILRWAWDLGLNFELGNSPVSYLVEPSIVTIPSQTSTTCQFTPVLCGSIQCHDDSLLFGYTADLSPENISDIWCGLYRPVTDDENHSTESKWTVAEQQAVCLDDSLTFAVPLILEQDLTLLKVTEEVPIQQHPLVASIELPLFDQFGEISLNQNPIRECLLIDSSIQEGKLLQDIPFVFAALRQVEITREFLPQHDHIIIHIRGPDQPVLVMTNLFQFAISTQGLRALGRPASLRQMPGHTQLCFGNSHPSATCPPGAFDKAMAVAIIRLLISNLAGKTQGFDDVQTVLRWHGRDLWSGRLHPNTKVCVLITILAIGLISTEEHSIRLVSLGKQMSNEWRIGDYPLSSRGSLPIQLTFGLRGGGASKVSQKILHKNAIAGALIQHGYDMQWISTTVDSLINKFGIPKLQAISAMPMGANKINAIHKLCHEAQIELPSPIAPATAKFANGAPRKKRQNTALNLSEFSALPGFFENEDSSSPPVLHDIRGQTHGLCLVTPEQILPWLRENQTISSDELGAIVVGTLPLHTDLDVAEVTFPCSDGTGQSVLLTGTLVQLGEKKITFTKGDPKQVTEEPCVLIAITLFQEDFPAEQWSECLHNTSSFIKRQFEEEASKGLLHSIWGRSLRNGRLPANAHQATSVQMHASIPAGQVSKVLAKSGFNRVFCTPKERSGRVSSQYKIAWLEGNHSHATVLAAKTQHCQGLVRGKNNLGLRFHLDHYEAAWKVIFPGTKVPEKVVGDLIFKVEGLPFGCTPDTLQLRTDAIKWVAKPLKALGPQSWLFRASVHPPPGLIMFNSHPVLVRHLPPKEQHQAPVLIGPKPRKVQNDGLQTNDPWASWTGPRISPAAGPSAPRSTTGPIDTRFGEQDAKIQSLQTEIKKMAEGQEKFQKDTAVMFDQIEAKDQKNMREVRGALSDLQKEFQSALASSISENSKKMDSNFQEIKALFRQSHSKRPLGANGPPDEEM